MMGTVNRFLKKFPTRLCWLITTRPGNRLSVGGRTGSFVSGTSALLLSFGGALSSVLRSTGSLTLGNDSGSLVDTGGKVGGNFAETFSLWSSGTDERTVFTSCAKTGTTGSSLTLTWALT